MCKEQLIGCGCYQCGELWRGDQIIHGQGLTRINGGWRLEWSLMNRQLHNLRMGCHSSKINVYILYIRISNPASLEPAPGNSRPALTDQAGVGSIQRTNPCCQSTLHTRQVIIPNGLTTAITKFSHDSTGENRPILMQNQLGVVEKQF